MSNPLLDLNFLKKLDLQNKKATYAKITLLTSDEEPVYEFQGKITQGSVNVDGNSAVRRTCSLTMVTKDFDKDNVYWGLKHKFKLAVGVENLIDQKYPEIIWFPQGYFIFSSLSESLNTTGYTISIQGKDKMCQLNGELGGMISAETDFGKYEYTDKVGVKNFEDIPIKTIIRNMVAVFGKVPYHKIILNDIDSYAVELLRYKGNTPLYMFKNISDGNINNMTFNKNQTIYINDTKTDLADKNLQFENFTSSSSTPNIPTVIGFNPKEETHTVIKISSEEEAGYRPTELTYPGDLIAKAGETVTSVLDKIKNMFSDFEYFYDIDGNFVFQKKRTFINTSWNNLVSSTNGIYANPNAFASPTSYTFDNNLLITAISMQPNISNIKNDYSIWGVRKTSSGEDLPIHMRYAIMEKPLEYTSFRGDSTITYTVDSTDEEKKECDWRELIYQMAMDYYNGKSGFQNEDFLKNVKEQNPQYPTGVTGYESFYPDMKAFWRQIYNPTAIDSSSTEKYVERDIPGSASTGLFSTVDGWNKDVIDNPAALNFWIDFLDTAGELNKYSIKNIGQRQKVISDNNITSVYFKDVPNVLYTTKTTNSDTILSELSGYTPVNLTKQYESYFSISPRKKSAKDELDSLLYQHTHAAETITLTTLPIYYLQPNTRILVNDVKNNINGEYILNKITIPLAYNGTSSLNATKVVERIY